MSKKLSCYVTVQGPTHKHRNQALLREAAGQKGRSRVAGASRMGVWGVWVQRGAVVAAVLAAVWLIPGAFAQTSGPAAPTGLAAESASGQVVLSWTDPGDASITGYEYRYRVNTDGSDWGPGTAGVGAEDGWVMMAGSHAGTTSFKVSGLTNGVEYLFEVRALAGADAVRGAVSGMAAAAGNPLAGFAAAPGDGRVVLLWHDPGDSGVTGYEYRLRWRDDPSAAWDIADAVDATSPIGDAANQWNHAVGAPGSWPSLPGADTPTSTRSTVEGLTNGREYQIQVRATGTARGRESTVTFVAGVPLAGLTATPSGSAVTLEWTSPGSTNISGYQYRYSSDGGETWQADWAAPTPAAAATGVSAVLPPGTANNASLTSFDVTGLSIGEEYTFQVRARAGSGHGASNTATSRVGNAFEGMAAAPGNGEVILSWDSADDPGISGYEYRYRPINGSTPTARWGAWTPMVGSSWRTVSWKISTGLVNGVEYVFQIRALPATVQGRESQVTAIVGVPLTGLVAVPSGSGREVALFWDFPGRGTGITGYQYRYGTRADDGTANWQTNAEADATDAPGNPVTDANGWTDGAVDPATTAAPGSFGNAATTGVTVTGLDEGTQYIFQIRATGPNSAHGASDIVTATAAAAAAPVPVITGVSPVGPSFNNMPVVNGVNAGAGATIRIYGSAGCEGPMLASGIAASDGSFAVTVEVADDSTSRFYATSDNGNESDCSATSATYVEDSTGPSTTINGGPAELTDVTDATFFLTASETASFECSLDGAAFAPCGQVVAYTDLGAGGHVFWAAATDTAGNIGEAVSRTWTIAMPEPEPMPDPRGCTIIGTDGDDQLVGTEVDDVICGLGGNDIIYGLGGNDIIYGDAGGDVIKGGSGDDRIYAGSGNDRVYGNAGDDMIRGGGGIDTIRGGKGDDTIYGNAGDDTIYGERGVDTIHGGPGNDSAKLGASDKRRSIENTL